MARISWKNRQPASLRQAMKLCIDYARIKHNRSVEQIADLMGLANHWNLYKWLENGRLPAVLIRPFESACGIDFVTWYIGHSAHKLLIEIPTGKKSTSHDINTLQATFTDAVGLLLKFYDGNASADETVTALISTMEQLAWHQGEVERHGQPELDFIGGE